MRMNRAPVVIGSTAIGLGLVLSFHTATTKHRSHLSIGSAPPGTTTPTTAAPGGTGAPPSSTATTPGETGAPPSATTTTPAGSDAARTATGQDVQYRYGDIQLQVTEKGSRITNITVVSNNGIDPRSVFINQQAVPMLQSQAMQSQSPNIDGVSGATFTSEAYAEALQSALQQLGA
jgi:uncharacterized protein with FMN-binding domain